MQAISRVRSPDLGWGVQYLQKGYIRGCTRSEARVELYNFTPVFDVLMCFPHFTRAWTKGMG